VSENIVDFILREFGNGKADGEGVVTGCEGIRRGYGFHRRDRYARTDPTCRQNARSDASEPSPLIDLYLFFSRVLIFTGSLPVIAQLRPKLQNTTLHHRPTHLVGYKISNLPSRTRLRSSTRYARGLTRVERKWEG